MHWKIPKAIAAPLIVLAFITGVSAVLGSLFAYMVLLDSLMSPINASLTFMLTLVFLGGSFAVYNMLED